MEPSSQGRPSLTQRKLALLPLLTGASQAFLLLLLPTPSTQDSASTWDAATSLLGDEGPPNTFP